MIALVTNSFGAMRVEVLVTIVRGLRSIVRLDVRRLSGCNASVPYRRLSLFRRCSSHVEMSVTCQSLNIGPSRCGRMGDVIHGLVDVPMRLSIGSPVANRSD